MEKKKHYLGIGLIFFAGLLDAYTYLYCGNCFATMQTGNLIYLCINLVRLDFAVLPKYAFAVLAFLLGVFFQHFLSLRKDGDVLSYLIMAIFHLSGFFLSVLGVFNVAVWLFSFGMGIQLQSVKSIYGYSVATTMCTGNMRSMTEHLAHFLSSKDKKYLKAFLLYGSLVLSFIVGIVFGAILCNIVLGGI